MGEFQIASAELQAADVEFERLKVNPEKPEGWDALERRYEAHKRLWLMFGGVPCDVFMNTMFNSIASGYSSLTRRKHKDCLRRAAARVR